MNILLANADVGSLVFIGVLLLILIVSPIFFRVKNKRDMETAQKMLDSLKKGDEVMTASGVIGKIISIDTKVGYKTITIETGDEKHKGYQTLDINAVYMNLSANPQQVGKVEEAKEEPKLEEEKPVEEEKVKEEEKPVEEVVEQPKKERKPRAKKTSKK